VTRSLPVWLSLLAFIACSSTTLPAELGNCIPGDEIPCSVGGGGGGGSSGGDSGAEGGGGSCSADPGASQCNQCGATRCCSTYDACASATACQELATCVYNCPTTGCITSCKQQFPTAVVAYQALESCVSLQCPVCNESGVGDPCYGDRCVAGLSCGGLGLWCTKSCLHASDCAGIGPNGGNVAAGEANVCVPTSNGNQCAPGCTTNVECIDFPGTYCHSTLSTDGATVQVCAAFPDASSD
jgi:hypothetical protein